MNVQRTNLNDLYRELGTARHQSVTCIARKISDIGFHCLRCGNCCLGKDAEVLVFPGEVRDISKVSGKTFLQIAEPPTIGEWDQNGSFHTLEWWLCRNEAGCSFYKDGCSIYGSRPLLCRTYPFHLVNGRLEVSECRGLGRDIPFSEAVSLAEALVERYTREIVEAIDLISKYNDFSRSSGPNNTSDLVIVHDSEGEHKIPLKELPSLKRRLDLLIYTASNHKTTGDTGDRTTKKGADIRTSRHLGADRQA